MELTLEQVKEILHGNPDYKEWHEALNRILPAYKINTKARIAGFLAQCCHESNNFKVLEENLNYSADGLNKIFPKYFKNAGRDANEYARQPEKIANVVYSNRMGNGSERSGDGWKFRGRGVIQLTGRDNYTNFGKHPHVGRSAEEVIGYLETKRGALASAAWYWESRNINAAADAGDIVKMTKLVNGGTIGLDDRKKHYEHILEILGGKIPEKNPANVEPNKETKTTMATVKRGDQGQTVKAVQAALGINDDGIFGPGTEAAVKAWQVRNGLTSDGIVGPATLKKLGLIE
jgi:putative chitinase